jgi:hypothetical protein
MQLRIGVIATIAVAGGIGHLEITGCTTAIMRGIATEPTTPIGIMETVTTAMAITAIGMATVTMAMGTEAIDVVIAIPTVAIMAEASTATEALIAEAMEGITVGPVSNLVLAEAEWDLVCINRC